jgi:hypothetical protein
MWWSIVLVLAAVAAQWGCISNPMSGMTAPAAPIELTRITPNAPEPVYYSGLSDSSRLVITDAHTLADVWNRVFATMGQPPAVPKVDFGHDRVLVAALGVRSSGGYRIEFDHASLEGGEVVAEVRATSPGAHCATSLALTQPVDIVKLPRSGSSVRFVESRATADCPN